MQKSRLYVLANHQLTAQLQVGAVGVDRAKQQVQSLGSAGDLTLVQANGGSGSDQSIELFRNGVYGVDDLLCGLLVAKHSTLVGQLQVIITLCQSLLALLQESADVAHSAFVTRG